MQTCLSSDAFLTAVFALLKSLIYISPVFQSVVEMRSYSQCMAVRSPKGIWRGMASAIPSVYPKWKNSVSVYLRRISPLRMSSVMSVSRESETTIIFSIHFPPPLPSVLFIVATEQQRFMGLNINSIKSCLRVMELHYRPAIAEIRCNLR